MTQVHPCLRADGTGQLPHELGVLPDPERPQLLTGGNMVGVHACLGAQVLAPDLAHGVGVEDPEGEVQAELPVNELGAQQPAAATEGQGEGLAVDAHDQQSGR